MKKEGKGMKRSFEGASTSCGGKRFGKSPALRDEEQQKKKLYMFFSHPGGVYSHSLYAVDALLDVPPAAASPSSTTTKVTTTTTTTTTTITGKKVTNVTTEETPSPHPRQAIEPILRFHRDGWPTNMSCASYGKQLFFLGGMKGNSYSREVHVLDLSTTTINNLMSFQDLPSQILKPAPRLKSGKIHQEVFVKGSKLYVLSGQKFNRSTAEELHRLDIMDLASKRSTGEELRQFEFMDLASKKPKWKVVAQPPFTNSDIGSLTIIDERLLVICARGRLSGPPEPHCLYSYDLKEDRWDDFDPTSWTKVTKSLDFFFCAAGAKCIGNFLFTTFRVNRDAIPIVIRLQKKEGDSDDEEEEVVGVEDGGEEEEMEEDYEQEEEVDLPEPWFDVIRSTIECIKLSSTLVNLGTAGSTRRMAFLQAGNPLPDLNNPWEDFNKEETHINLSFFDIVGGRTPTYVTSSHYLTKLGRISIIAGAHLV